MWKGYHDALSHYGFCICDEWIRRGFEDNIFERFVENPDAEMPPWLGNVTLHSSHRAVLLYKSYSFYKQYGWTEQPKDLVIWPV